MTVVTNDPAALLFISSVLFMSYFKVVSCVAVVYDWVLAFGKEVHYIRILYAVQSPSLDDRQRVEDNDSNSCLVLYFMWTWTPIVVNAMLGALLASTIASSVITVIANIGVSVAHKTHGQVTEEFIIFGYHISD
ncbi:hypothetical protein BD769DRAFT_1393268 [Suillus cothurnatus]|nr:hypothetical protein BD769DRAFT_1393268 [Suillus cothurnatus]